MLTPLERQLIGLVRALLAEPQLLAIYPLAGTAAQLAPVAGVLKRFQAGLPLVESSSRPVQASGGKTVVWAVGAEIVRDCSTLTILANGELSCSA